MLIDFASSYNNHIYTLKQKKKLYKNNTAFTEHENVKSSNCTLKFQRYTIYHHKVSILQQYETGKRFPKWIQLK